MEVKDLDVLTGRVGLGTSAVLDSSMWHGHVGQAVLHCCHIHAMLQGVQLAVIAWHGVQQPTRSVHIVQPQT